MNERSFAMMDPRALRLHPAADLVPRMRPDEWQSFLEDIRLRGILEPLQVASDGVTVLDGRHRLDAALELGLAEVPTKPAPLNGGSEIEYMLRAASLRRHLSDDQRAVLAARLREELSEQAKRQGAETANAARWTDDGSLSPPVGEKDARTDTRALAAQQFGVSRKKVERAVEVTHAAPELAEQVAAGALPLSRAVVEIKRRALAEQAAHAAPLPDDIRLLAGDFRQVAAEVAPESVDLILTDPPYAREYRDLWPALAELATRVLKPTGLLITLVGHELFAEVFTALTTDLHYVWLGTLCHPGSEVRMWSHQCFVGSKPVLILAKTADARATGWWHDTAATKRQKDAHDWQQDAVALAKIATGFVQPGDLILDPMLGGGTSGIVARRLQCRFIGIECVPDTLAIARGQLTEDRVTPVDDV